MGHTIYENGPIQATLFAGPARADGGDRRWVQINNGAAFVKLPIAEFAAIAKAAPAEGAPAANQATIASCTGCGGWTMVCTPTCQNRVVWTRIAREAGDVISYVDHDELDEVLTERGACACPGVVGSAEAKECRWKCSCGQHGPWGSDDDASTGSAAHHAACEVRPHAVTIEIR